jgi:hypothetical protein
MRNLEELYNTGIAGGKMFVGQNVDRNQTSVTHEFYPDMRFMGAPKECEVLNQLMDFMQRTISTDFTSESVFLGEFNRWTNSRTREINIIDGKLIFWAFAYILFFVYFGNIKGIYVASYWITNWQIIIAHFLLCGLTMSFAFTGKGNTSSPIGLKEIINAGAVGLKLHEDWGTTPAAIDNCLTVADEFDIQITIHTDTLNESCCVEDTLQAIDNRTIHTYHSEGAGGG